MISDQKTNHRDCLLHPFAFLMMRQIFADASAYKLTTLNKFINHFCFSGSVTPELMRLLFGRTIISRENVCLVQMPVLYKTHLDATIHWCNLPAHFWRTNYWALVKQTIWKASPLNCTCPPPLPCRCSFCASIISSSTHIFVIRT